MRRAYLRIVFVAGGVVWASLPACDPGHSTGQSESTAPAIQPSGSAVSTKPATPEEPTGQARVCFQGQR